MSLQAALLDPRRFVLLYGTTPPRASTPPERVRAAAERLVERVAPLPLDGLVVYDVQDESSRTSEPRPFPFLPTVESPVYARLLQQLGGRSAITYKCVANASEATWEDWLSRAHEEYGIEYLSLVGLASSSGRHSSLSLPHATRLAAAHPAGFTLGGVVIAERHSPERSESLRIIQKGADGCRFFISQMVYHPEATLRFLSDYARDCAARGVAPQRIVLTFTPCGRPQTMAFMKWLGVQVPPATEQAILSDPAPLAASIRICRENLRSILEHPIARQVPLGVNVESVSITKEEIAGSAELCQSLYGLAREYGFV